MAEEKKKPKAKPKDEGEGNGPLWNIIAVLVFLLIIVSFVNRNNFFNKTPEGNLDFSNTLSLSDQKIKKGTEIVNKELTKVRQSIGGAIIGEQTKREIGKIVEGPVEAYGQNWFRVDYAEAPDGWVASSQITDKIGIFRTLNIFPTVLNILKPIGYIISFILLVVLFFIFRMNKEASKLENKKKEVEKEIISQRQLKANKRSTDFVEDIKDVGAIPGMPTNLPIGDIKKMGLSFEKRGQEMDATGPRNKKWERVEKLMTSHSSSDWRQAIIEADILLEEMVTKIGYQGETLGEQLKNIEESDFVTLNKAWEAHKFRNHIAHKGGDFTFSKDEAQRVIELYRNVFEEFYYI